MNTHADNKMQRAVQIEADPRWSRVLARDASAAQLGLAQIADAPLILYPRTPRPGFIDYLMGLFHARDIAPAQVQEVDDVLTATALVASGLGLALFITLYFVEPADKQQVGDLLNHRNGVGNPACPEHGPDLVDLILDFAR